MSVFLKTDRLVLRRFTDADVDRLLALDNDPGVMRFINGGRPTSRENVGTQVLPRLLHHHPSGLGIGGGRGQCTLRCVPQWSMRRLGGGS